jgi:uncharacterized protein
MATNNKEIVKQIDAAFAKGDAETFLSYCADNVVWTTVGDKSFQGKDAIRQWLAAMKMEPPKFTVTGVIAEGDNVVSHGNMTMKDKDGKTAPYAYCDIYQLRNAKITALTTYVMKTEA